MSVIDDMENELAKVLAEEIDWEILTDIMISSGWTKVSIDRFRDRYHSIDIQSWLDDNCKGHYKNRGSTFVFEKAEDAEWFSLKWL